ncbi:calcium-binding protein [Bradyrhizobium sp. CCBAU 051011]|uniref:glycoside hydrolase family 113 n=1 Tax=Bradyrhizobium sp. CCBAU 051011 TaxID=858422 RepID=UPI00137B2A43|nr:calcium-binding protein [Bradyrhizobium sp. CCBAU 051011]
MTSTFDVQGFGALSEWNGQFSSASAKQAFQKIASLGSNSIELTARIWTQTGTSNSVFADPAKTESDASLLAGFQAAHDAGLSVLFKAALSTLNGTRVSSLAPADVADFFASYKAEIVHLATIAQAAGVETFAIGNEMSSLSGAPYRGYWIDIIGAVRDVYHGELTYAAATDEASHVSFWDQLDTIGVNTYPPLTASNAPTVQDLIDAWTEVPVNPYYAAAFDYKSPVDFLHSLATKYDKPLLMTEVGYRSVDGTAISPGSWTSNGTADVQEQADAYNAFLQVWTAHGGGWFKGVELWQWDLNNQYSSTGYSVMGKPAEAVVSQYFHGGGAVPDLAITGSAVADLIDLGRGDDTIDAGLGDDVIHGGAGADIIVGGPATTGKLSVTTVTLVGYGSVVGGVGAQAQIKVNGQPVSGLMEFKPAADPSEYQTFTISFVNPSLISSIDINLANATPGRALHIKDFLINGVALAPADAANASSPGTFDLYVHNIHVDTASHQDWFSGAATDNDVIDGGAGNDVITGGIGDDIIDGGAEIDTARFTGNIRDYDIAIADGQLIVNDRIAGRDGSDHLSHLEFLRFADGVIDARELFATLANSSGSTLQVLATDGAGKIIGQLLRHADGSDLYSFAIAASAAPQQPVDSNAFERAGPDAAGHLPDFLQHFAGGFSDQFILDAAPRQMDFGGIAQRVATAGNDTFVFSEAVRFDAAGVFKAADFIGHDVSRSESTVTADVGHLSGHDAGMDPGHDASDELTGIASLTAHHLLFT